MTENQAAAYEPVRNPSRCPEPECKDSPIDGMHFTGGYDFDGGRFYREFDEGCPWAEPDA